jgi:hypothetical protein
MSNTSYTLGDHFYYKVVFPLIDLFQPDSITANERREKGLYESATRVTAAADNYFSRVDQIATNYRNSQVKLSRLDLNSDNRAYKVNMWKTMPEEELRQQKDYRLIVQQDTECQKARTVMLQQYTNWMGHNGENEDPQGGFSTRIVSVVRSAYMHAHTAESLDQIMTEAQRLQLGSQESLIYAYYEALGEEYKTEIPRLLKALEKLEGNFAKLEALGTQDVVDDFSRKLNELIHGVAIGEVMQSVSVPINLDELRKISFTDKTGTFCEMSLVEFLGDENARSLADALDGIRINEQALVKDIENRRKAKEALKAYENELKKDLKVPLEELLKVADDQLKKLGDAGQAVIKYRQLATEHQRLVENSKKAIEEGLAKNNTYQELIQKVKTCKEEEKALAQEKEKIGTQLQTLEEKIKTNVTRIEHMKAQIRPQDADVEMNDLINSLNQTITAKIDSWSGENKDLELKRVTTVGTLEKVTQEMDKNEEMVEAAHLQIESINENAVAQYGNVKKIEALKVQLEEAKTQELTVTGMQLVKAGLADINPAVAALKTQREEQQALLDTASMNLQAAARPLIDLGIARDENCLQVDKDGGLHLNLDLGRFITPEKVFEKTKQYSLENLHRQSTELMQKMIAMGAQKKKDLGISANEFKLDSTDELQVAAFHEKVCQMLDKAHVDSSTINTERSARQKHNGPDSYSVTFMKEEIQKRMVAKPPQEAPKQVIIEDGYNSIGEYEGYDSDNEGLIF